MIGRKIIYKDALDSTNNYVANLHLNHKIEHGTVILAGSQSSGKGQRGAVWDSEPYKNITFSCFLEHDNLAVSHHFLLNQLVSLACVDFLNHYHPGFQIKWPNDLVFGNAKIAGILVENQLRQDKIASSIVGIGININQTEFGAYNATSLKSLTKQDFDLNELSLALTNKLNSGYEQLLRYDFDSIRSAYLEHLWLYRQSSDFEDAEGRFQGEIVGVDEYGQLQVKIGDEIRKYQNKEITFLERQVK